MRPFVFRALVGNCIHERVRGGYRIAKFLGREMDSVPIQIEVNARRYTCQLVELIREERDAVTVTDPTNGLHIAQAESTSQKTNLVLLIGDERLLTVVRHGNR